MWIFVFIGIYLCYVVVVSICGSGGRGWSGSRFGFFVSNVVLGKCVFVFCCSGKLGSVGIYIVRKCCSSCWSS